jgi:hypothetical protein
VKSTVTGFLRRKTSNGNDFWMAGPGEIGQQWRWVISKKNNKNVLIVADQKIIPVTRVEECPHSLPTSAFAR